MGPRWFGRVGMAALVSSLVLVFVACDDRYYDDYGYRGRRYTCEQPVRQCQTYCTDWCDGWGYCYPYCYDDCWTECLDAPGDGAGAGSSGGSSSGGGADAAPSTDAGGGATNGDGGGALCTPCAGNADCQSGALCIFYGVPTVDASITDPDAAAPPSTSASFCGQSCTGADCPTGFTCATLGTRRQCVPTAGRCQ